MGGIKFSALNKVAKQIWGLCVHRKLWIFAEYVASKENPVVEGSRINNPDTEWELSNFAFSEITMKLGFSSVDLFASRINAKCQRFCP